MPAGAQGHSVKTWILTGSPENFAATAEHGFTLAGMKERRLKQAQDMRPGDRIIYYLTKIQSFAAITQIESDMFEDRTAVWPGKPGKADPYPWRFETSPVLVLQPDAFLPAEELAQELEHIRKWPPEHWKLAFQGQLRTISNNDAALIEQRMRASQGGSA